MISFPVLPGKIKRLFKSNQHYADYLEVNAQLKALDMDDVPIISAMIDATSLQ